MAVMAAITVVDGLFRGLNVTIITAITYWIFSYSPDFSRTALRKQLQVGVSWIDPYELSFVNHFELRNVW